MTHGGKREGAGRPKGKGPWGEATRPIRVPLSLVESVVQFLGKRGYQVPIYASKVPAGNPSQPSDDIDEMTDINSMLLQNPEHCFLLKVIGDSMINAGICEGDVLVVDRSIEPINGKIVVAMIDGQATVKRLKKNCDEYLLLPENDNYSPIRVTSTNEFSIAGVVVGVVRKL